MPSGRHTPSHGIALLAGGGTAAARGHQGCGGYKLPQNPASYHLLLGRGEAGVGGHLLAT